MSKSINLLDRDYSHWLTNLCSRYRQSQIKASVRINHELLRFYWTLGQDIVNLHVEERWGQSVIKTLAADLQREFPAATCFSQTNIYYTKKFYLLYSQVLPIFPQVVGKIVPQVEGQIVPQLGENSAQGNLPQVEEEFDEEQQYLVRIYETMVSDICHVPWGHHRYLIDKCSDNPSKAMFYVRQTIENGWSRSMLLTFLSSDLYERQGKAQTNFDKTLPAPIGDLAQELTKDPYLFDFTGITGRYNERLLKNALLNNITNFLIELGTGFAYVGKEYRLQIGEKERFIDLLFYNLKLSCYVVVEVKIGEFDFADAGQLSGYVVACNHILRREGRDNPTIGLLICKERDRLIAQYALEGSNLPLGISEFELNRLYPESVEGTMPTIEEIEAKLSDTKQ